MGRAVTKNAQGELEVTESFTFSGSTPTLDSVKLIAVDGEEATVENPSWLGFDQSASGSDIDVTIQIDADGGLSTYTTYTFRVEVSDDAGNSKSRRVDVGIGSLATDFTVAVVMGQEDKYRSKDGSRIERGGTARIVAHTSMPSSVDIDYAQNPANVDNPTFQQSKKNVSQQKTRHEFFLTVIPSSLYAFQLTIRADYDQSVPDIVTDTYYFSTGSEIGVAPAEGLLVKVADVERVVPSQILKTLSTENYFNFKAGSFVSLIQVSGGLIESEQLVGKNPDVTVGPIDSHGNQFKTLFSYQTV